MLKDPRIQFISLNFIDMNILTFSQCGSCTSIFKLGLHDFSPNFLQEKQELFTLPDHLRSPLVLVGSCCSIYCFLCSVCWSFFFWPLYFVSLDLRLWYLQTFLTQCYLYFWWRVHFFSMQSLWCTFIKVHWSSISWIASDLLDRQSTNKLIWLQCFIVEYFHNHSAVKIGISAISS